MRKRTRSSVMWNWRHGEATSPLWVHLHDCYHFAVETLQFWSFHVVPSINCWKKKTTIITTSDWQKGNQTSHPKVVSPQVTSPKPRSYFAQNSRSGYSEEALAWKSKDCCIYPSEKTAQINLGRNDFWLLLSVQNKTFKPSYLVFRVTWD